MDFHLEGVLPAMLTPFTKDGEHVDYEKATALATRLADAGVHGLFIAGTTGEGPLMRLDERKRLLEEVIQTVGDRVKVVAHSGCLDTPGTLELTRHARDVGAAAVGVVAPAFYRYDRAALVAHYTAAAKAVEGFPVLLYNLPGCTKNPLPPDLILHLADTVENIVGIKDSGGRMQQLNAVLAKAPKGFIIINGVDEYMVQALMTGAHGSVASTANVVPELFLSIYNHVKKGDLGLAWDSQKALGHACGLFQYGAMVAYYKEALRMRGFDAGYVRPPQRELKEEEKSQLARGMENAGLL